jgi:hypothetical protein
MTIRREDGAIRLEGDCRVEEAETLLQMLQTHPDAPVDLSQCRHLHGALVQVLLVFKAKVSGAPETAFLRDLVLPNLTADRPTS